MFNMFQDLEKNQLENHVVWAHINRPLYSCDICRKKYRRQEALISHQRLHSKSDSTNYKYTCEKCDHRFKSTSALKEHQRVHEPPSYRCNICHKKIMHHSGFNKHVRAHSEEKGKVCEICGRGFSFIDLYRDHMEKEHKIARFACSACDKTFIDRGSFKNHLTTHTDESLCKICNKKFARLRQHMDHVHNENRRKFICDICGKEIGRRSSLQGHKRAIHFGVKVKCDRCGKEFTNKGWLTVHLRTHTGKKPHTCNFCGKKFSRNNTLTVHLRTHTGEKPYDCTLCGQKIVSKSTCGNHLKIKHKTL